MVVHGSRQGYLPDTELRVIDRRWEASREEIVIQVLAELRPLSLKVKL